MLDAVMVLDGAQRSALAAVIEAADRVGADIILPMTDASTMLLVAAAAQSRLPNTIRIAVMTQRFPAQV